MQPSGLFGRVTYQLMAAFWPSEEAIRADPVVAEGMNRSEKIVFSRTLDEVHWHNTRLVKRDMLGLAFQAMKSHAVNQDRAPTRNG